MSNNIDRFLVNKPELYITWVYDKEANRLTLKNGDNHKLTYKDGIIIGDIIFEILLGNKSNSLLIVDFLEVNINEDFINGILTKVKINPYFFNFSTHFINIDSYYMSYYNKNISKYFNNDNNEDSKSDILIIKNTLSEIVEDINNLKDDIRAIKIALGDQDED